MITVFMMVIKNIILNQRNINSIFLLDKSFFEPIVLKGHDGFLGEKEGVIPLTYQTTVIKTTN